jgi:hypothetical protein
MSGTSVRRRVLHVRVGPKGGLYEYVRPGLKRRLGGNAKDYITDLVELKRVELLQTERSQPRPKRPPVQRKSKGNVIESPPKVEPSCARTVATQYIWRCRQ